MPGDFDLMAALNAAPSLSSSPSLALGAAQAAPGQPDQIAQHAQTIGSAAEYSAAQKALDTVQKHTGLLGTISGAVGSVMSGVAKLPGIGGAISTAAQWANKGLSNAQHEYRYLLDITHRHGAAAGLGELAIMAAGGVAGGVAGGLAGGPAGAFYGAVGGSEGAGYLSHFLPAFNDSWERSKPGAAGYEAGHSFGRDVTSHIPWLRDPGTAHNLSSGLLDAIFDVAADPAMAAGKIVAPLRVVKDATDVSALRLSLAKTVGLADNPDALRVAYDGNSAVRRAVDQIAETKSASDIRRIYPKATESEIRGLAATGDANEVIQFIGDKMRASNVLNTAPRLGLFTPYVSSVVHGFRNGDEAANQGAASAVLSGAPVEETTQDAKMGEKFIRRWTTRLPMDADPNNLMPRQSFHLNGPNADAIIHDIA